MKHNNMLKINSLKRLMITILFQKKRKTIFLTSVNDSDDSRLYSVLSGASTVFSDKGGKTNVKQIDLSETDKIHFRMVRKTSS